MQLTLGNQPLSNVQVFTPEWAAVQLIERFFPDLHSADLVCEPSAGRGAFLKAIPPHVPAFGVELDTALAQIAAQHTGRKVLAGDFTTIDLPDGITQLIGNPPFEMETVERFLSRARHLLPDLGRVGFVLPAYAFQTYNRVTRWFDHWSINVEMMPRGIFPGLSKPLTFAVFTKDRKRSMVGLCLYFESRDLDHFSDQTKGTLRDANSPRSAWLCVVDEHMARLGGKAHVSQLYRSIEHHRPTNTDWWKEQIRKVLQFNYTPLGEGWWQQKEATC